MSSAGLQNKCFNLTLLDCSVFTEFTEGHQYRRTDGLVSTGLMLYKAHSPKYQHFMLFLVPVYSKYEI